MKHFITILFIFIILFDINAKTKKKYDKFEKCDIYQASEDTELNFYIYEPINKSLKPYMKMIAKLTTTTEIINMKGIIVLNNIDERLEFKLNKDTNEVDKIVRPPSMGANGMMTPGSTILIQRSALNLSDEQIKLFSDYFKNSKKAEVRFVGSASNKDVKIDFLEMKEINYIFKKWYEITTKVENKVGKNGNENKIEGNYKEDIILEIDSKKGWKDTGIEVTPTNKIIIQYVSGEWTTWYKLDKVDANGHIGDTGSGGRVKKNAQTGALIGKIKGNLKDKIFTVGNFCIIDNTNNDKVGTLYVRINEKSKYCENNDGTIKIRILVE